MAAETWSSPAGAASLPAVAESGEGVRLRIREAGLVNGQRDPVQPGFDPQRIARQRRQRGRFALEHAAGLGAAPDDEGGGGGHQEIAHGPSHSIT
jgi:hypothetical protein